MSLAECQINLIDVNFYLQKSLEIFDKNSADKNFVFITLVGSLPTTYQSSFGGATAVTSATLDGAYVQHEEHLYELQCKFNFGYLYQLL